MGRTGEGRYMYNNNDQATLDAPMPDGDGVRCYIAQANWDAVHRDAVFRVVFWSQIEYGDI